MSTDSWKLAFWQVVTDCLVTFHGRQAAAARMEVLTIRAQIENVPADVEPELVYHAEAYEVAVRIAGVDADPSPDRQAYEQIWRNRLEGISEETATVARARIHPR